MGVDDMKWLFALGFSLCILAIEIENPTIMWIGFILGIFADFVRNADKK